MKIMRKISKMKHDDTLESYYTFKTALEPFTIKLNRGLNTKILLILISKFKKDL